MLLHILYIERNLDQIILFKNASTKNKFFFLKIAFMHTQAVFHKELRVFSSFLFLLFLSCSLNKSFTTSAPLLLEISHHYKRKVS